MLNIKDFIKEKCLFVLMVQQRSNAWHATIITFFSQVEVEKLRNTKKEEKKENSNKNYFSIGE